jgi:alpha-galactosidase/6-phospho-beta-glucosidase family protein
MNGPVRAKQTTIFGVKPGEVVGKGAGINHFIWVTGPIIEERDVYDELPVIVERVLCGEIDPDPGDTSPFVDKAKA